MMSVDGSVDCQWAVNVADHVGGLVNALPVGNVAASKDNVKDAKHKRT